MATNDSTGLDDNGTDVSQQLQLEAMKQAIAATKSSAGNASTSCWGGAQAWA